MTDFLRLARAVACADPLAAFDVAADTLQNLVGWRMLTVMSLASESLQLTRIYSSEPLAYPVGGGKSKRGLPWAEQVLIRGERFVGHDRQSLRWAFDDAERLESLGLGAVINQPIISGGLVLGTLNLLDVEGSYGDAWRAEQVELAAALLRPVLLGYQPSA
ncbi:MAG TPA: GAF domain-containing protein [Caulobacteraceae bacterium]|nr:GAF domain-containing protein [Caulobacteraceae bacterium]